MNIALYQRTKITLAPKPLREAYSKECSLKGRGGASSLSPQGRGLG